MLTRFATDRDCRFTTRWLWEYAKGELSVADSARIQQHIEDCAGCAKRLGDVRASVELLATAHAANIVDKKAGWHELRAGIERQKVGGWASRPAFRPVAVIGWGAAAAACALVLSIAFRHAVPHGAVVASVAPRQDPSAHDRNATPSVQPHRALARKPPEPRGDIRDGDVPGPSIGNPGSRAWSRSSTQIANARQTPRDDMDLLNAPADRVLAGWMSWKPDAVAAMKSRVDDAARKSGKGDAFVQVPFPRLASADPDSLRAAAREYQSQKEIVDPRLQHDVTVAAKAMPLGELCQQLAKMSGIDLSADKTVADENVTLFCEETPLREVMRQINRLFGFYWGRTGEEGSYRYVLNQSLRARLAEEEMRNHDQHEALIALDEKVRQMLGQDDKEKPYKWVGAKAYELLGTKDRDALANGESLELTCEGAHFDVLSGAGLLAAPGALGPPVTDGTNSGPRIPSSLRTAFLRASGYCVGAWGGREQITSTRRTGNEPSLANISDAYPFVMLHIDRSEAGELSLKVDEEALIASRPELGKARFGMLDPVASAQSPSASSPDNARRNAELRKLPSFQKVVSVRPISSCPHYAPDAKKDSPDDDQWIAEFIAKEGPHVLSNDVWEAVHKATGMPVIADSYSRYYPMAEVSADKASLFDALCKIGDNMGVRWRKEDSFIAARSTSFIWDKMKEVPRRLLLRWQADSRRSGGLPFADLLEIASLSEQQIGSANVGKTIEHCWGLSEWGMVGAGQPRPGSMIPANMIPYFRLLTALPSGTMNRLFTREGLPLREMPEWQRERWATAARGWADPGTMQNSRILCNYAPANAYVWHPEVKMNEMQTALCWPIVTANTKEAALTKARALYPSARPNQIERSHGEFFIQMRAADGRISPIHVPVMLAAD